MFTLVIGGSASGKSEYAERHVLSLHSQGPRIYIATMEPFGEEAQARIARHHAMRADRGFETIECYRNAGAVRLPENSNVLLEDLGNLAANELFGADQIPEENASARSEQKDADKDDLHARDLSAETAAGTDRRHLQALTDRLAADIESLHAQCSHLTIVTNEVFSGGKEYEGETLTYLRLLAALNRKLAARADLLVEVVCGIPDILKDRRKL